MSALPPDVEALRKRYEAGLLDEAAYKREIERYFPPVMEARLRFSYPKPSSPMIFVETIAWTPDGRSLAIGVGDKPTEIWALSAPRKHPRPLLDRVPAPPHPGEVPDTPGAYSLAWSPDGQYLAAGQRSGLVEIWELATSRIVAQFRRHQEAAEVPSQELKVIVAWSPDGEHLASGDVTGYCLVWSPFTGRIASAWRHSQPSRDPDVRQTPDPHLSVSWSPKGNLLLVKDQQQRLSTYDPRSGELVTRIGSESPRYTAAWSPDGLLIASGGWREGIHMWNPKTGEEIIHYDTMFETFVRELTWHPGGEWLAYRSTIGTLECLHLKTGTRHVLYSNARDLVLSEVRWSPTGKQLAFVEVKSRVRILQTEATSL